MLNDLYNLKVYFSEFYIELLSIDFRLIESQGIENNKLQKNIVFIE